ncbi:MAG: type II toxin-antitoxin system RelE/ParE family toxin [Burkholderiales bacterium]|nr:type II toxin-antitoxin system RelE/ParE family toxin [Burkholderiales bacterium]
MAAVYFSARALAELDRLFDLIAEHDPASAVRTARRITEAVGILREHPLIGRPVRSDTRELVISSGRTGYVALYRLRNGVARVEILTIRHQREAGYRERAD